MIMDELKQHQTEKPEREKMPEPSNYSVAVLTGLGAGRGNGVWRGRHGKQHAMHTERHVYGGTVLYAEVQRRRKASRVARKSRRVNRLRAR